MVAFVVLDVSEVVVVSVVLEVAVLVVASCVISASGCLWCLWFGDCLTAASTAVCTSLQTVKASAVFDNNSVVEEASPVADEESEAIG